MATLFHNFGKILRGINSFFYYFLIVITIPLAFDVGGQDCGIAYTCTLTVFYFVLSTIKVLTRGTKLRVVASGLYHLQQIIIPSLLILHLSVYSPPPNSSASQLASNFASTHFGGEFGQQFQSEATHLWKLIIQVWKWFVENATPLFTTLEGFCTLLVIQVAGRFSSWLVRTKSDFWVILILLCSSCTISTSLYFLYRIYTFPVAISLLSASLIGVVLTITTIVGLYGIVSGRGNTVESSLLFAYIVYCLYFTFTDFQSSIISASSSFLYFFAPSSRQDIPPLPPVIIDGYTTLVSTVAELVPTGFKTVFEFLQGAVSTVTPSVFVSLAYRLAVFFAATRIVPVVHDISNSSRRGSMSETDLDEVFLNEQIKVFASDGSIKSAETSETSNALSDDMDESPPTSFSSATTLIPSSPRVRSSRPHSIKVFIFSYAPCILIAIYTHLMIQHLTLFASSHQSTSSINIPSTTTNNTSIQTKISSSIYSTDQDVNTSSISISLDPPIWTWQSGWTNPRDSWQFWGWVNMFWTLFLYTLELIYGKKNNSEEVLENHWKEKDFSSPVIDNDDDDLTNIQ